MKKEIRYRYFGRNGIITTPIKLEPIDPITMIYLQASQNKILTNGIKKAYEVIVFEDEVDNWTEIDEDGQN